MNLAKLADFAKYMAEPGRSTSEICRYAALDLFQEMAPRSLYLAQLLDDGNVSPIGAFGFRKMLVESWGAFPLTLHTPMTFSIKTNSVIYVQSPEEGMEKFPALFQFEDFDTEWKSLISWPMLPFGACSLLLDNVIKPTKELEYHLTIIGQTIALALSRNDLRSVAHGVRSKIPRSAPAGLTDRQKLVRSLLEKGYTNGQIAREIGYSESLVRHESIAIYAALKVSGRRDLIENPQNNATAKSN